MLLLKYQAPRSAAETISDFRHLTNQLTHHVKMQVKVRVDMTLGIYSDLLKMGEYLPMKAPDSHTHRSMGENMLVDRALDNRLVPRGLPGTRLLA